MDERATGLILCVRPLTETSLIVHWLTAEHGRLATVAKGARRPRSPLRGKLDLFYLCDFSFLRSRRSDLHLLREAGVRDTHLALRRELAWLVQAAYAATLIEQTTESDAPLPGHFQLLLGLVRHLPSAPPRAATVFAFELKLLDESGLRPDLAGERLSPGVRQALARLAAGDWEEAGRLRLSAGQSAEARQFLHGFLEAHFGRVPRQRATALAGSAPD